MILFPVFSSVYFLHRSLFPAWVGSQENETRAKRAGKAGERGHETRAVAPGKSILTKYYIPRIFIVAMSFRETASRRYRPSRLESKRVIISWSQSFPLHVVCFFIMDPPTPPFPSSFSSLPFPPPHFPSCSSFFSSSTSSFSAPSDSTKTSHKNNRKSFFVDLDMKISYPLAIRIQHSTIIYF